MTERPPDKPGLRDWARERRSTLDMGTLSAQLRAALVDTDEWRLAGRILLYAAMPGEVDLLELADDPGKSFFLPRCAPKRRLAIHPYQPGATPMRPGPFGIREPDPGGVDEARPEQIDLAVVPALLLSENGDRLGYGGGYYDRFLPRLRPDAVTVGVLPDALVVPALPIDPWDHPLRMIVTPTRTLRFATPRGAKK